MFKKDSFFLGIIVGLILPCLMFFLFYGTGILFDEISNRTKYFTLSSQIIISIAVNVLPIRYYFVSLKFDKSGRGVLLITFIMVIVYFSLDIDKLIKA